MSVPLLAAVTLAYVAVAISEFIKGNIPMAIVFGSYAAANVGLIMAVA